MNFGATTGSLDFCGYCGMDLELTGGTDPFEKGPRGEWHETYECPNGHTGRYEYVDETRRQTFKGACARYNDEGFR